MSLMRNGLVRWVGAGVLPILAGCHEAVPPPVSGTVTVHRTPQSASEDMDGDTRLEGISPPERIRIGPDADESNRWLFVERARSSAEGAWATGSFDAARNKIDIRTREVQRFAIDATRIPIDWERVVILGIDGRNSELRRRDFSVYHFTRDDHGRWIVVER